MQIDMHFYGVYTLARAAGIKDNTARLIALSSQYVDDAIEDEEIVVSNNYGILPLITSHKPTNYKNTIKEDNWRVWLPFHFLPGLEPENGNFFQKLVCRKNSRVARKMLLDALDDKNRDLWPHLIGIIAHVFADTFAHYGFIGISSQHNIAISVKSLNVMQHGVLKGIEAKFIEIAEKLAGLVPIGHATVGINPDIPFLSWEYQYETKSISPEIIVRKNSEDFLEGAKELHSFFSQYAQKAPEIADKKSKCQWEEIQSHVKAIIEIQEDSYNNRAEKWKEAINKGVFFAPTTVDRDIHYDEWQMQLQRIKEIKAPPDIAHQDNGCKFIRAAQYHLFYVLQHLLPEFGLLVS